MSAGFISGEKSLLVGGIIATNKFCQSLFSSASLTSQAAAIWVISVTCNGLLLKFSESLRPIFIRAQVQFPSRILWHGIRVGEDGALSAPFTSPVPSAQVLGRRRRRTRANRQHFCHWLLPVSSLSSSWLVESHSLSMSSLGSLSASSLRNGQFLMRVKFPTVLGFCTCCRCHWKPRVPSASISFYPPQKPFGKSGSIGGAIVFLLWTCREPLTLPSWPSHHSSFPDILAHWYCGWRRISKWPPFTPREYRGERSHPWKHHLLSTAHWHPALLL